MNPMEQQFFTDLEKKLWTAAGKLRSSLDASVYKHWVPRLIFLKYVPAGSARFGDAADFGLGQNRRGC